MSHEVSEGVTVRPQTPRHTRQVVNISRKKGGVVLQGPYESTAEADEMAKARSRALSPLAPAMEPPALPPLDELIRKSLGGSATFSKVEVRRGYRKLG
jgi:hypothetical protein